MKIRFYPALISAFFGSLVVTAIASFSVAPSAAQGVAAARGQDRIGVIDIKYILENHVRFKQSMEQLRQQFEAAGKQLNEEKQRIIGMEKRLAELNAGTPDYNALDEQISRAKADWTVKANKQRKEIQNSEAQILWNVYYEIKTETKRYCEQNGFGLVISFNGEPIDSKNPQQVVKGISRPIVYNAQNIDITPWILKSLNQGAGVQAADQRGAPAQNLPQFQR